MAGPGNLAVFFEFTENEVTDMYETYDMSFDETQVWYDGYTFPLEGGILPGRISIYSPKSVVEAMLPRNFRNYWN